ncbi:MAG TPA: HlyD family efflux transporter periplasmic adaptor subunit, partial [Thermoanaerobaculia bacterium]|nr:HlyD family efflux transporter periplasmic adaptor subunit [Thermoanaerobaculia bacterium]
SVIRAPFDGVITERFARIGQKVLLDDNTPLFKITALEPLLTRVYFPEQTIGRLRLGQTVLVSAAEFPTVTTTGKVTFLSPIVDPGSGSFQVMVTVARDAGKVLRPGMSVNLRFVDEQR